MISSWAFFWLVSGEVSGSQHHQPSGSNWSGVYSRLVGNIQLTSPTWWGVSVSAKQLKDIVMYIPWGGNRTLPQGCTIVSFDCFSLISYPLPSLISICLNLPSGKIMEAAWSLFPIIKKWGTGDFLVGTVDKSLRSQCKGPRFDPWSGN